MATAKVHDIAITSLETITAFSLTGNEYLWTLDELQNASIANTQEKQDITGKGGRKLASLKRNKGATVSGANGMFSAGLLAMQAGAELEDGDYEVQLTDYLVVETDDNNTENDASDDKLVATLKHKAIGTAGAEIIALYVKDETGYATEELVQGTDYTLGSDKKTITFTKTREGYTAKVADGSEVVVYYKAKLKATGFINLSDKYSGTCKLYVDAMGEDKCGNIYHVQFYFPKADFNGEFTFEMGDNQSVHNFEAEALAGACGAGGKLWDMVIFGENAEDAA